MKAYFIDGITSKKRDCEITFLIDSLIISYYDDDSNNVKTNWKVSDINKLDVKTSSKSLKYGDFPHEVLEFNSIEDLNEMIEKYPDYDFHKSAYNKFASFGWKSFVLGLISIIFVGIVFFIYGVPFIADVFARNIPKEYETEIGKNFQQSYLQYFEIDNTKSSQIQSFYDNMNIESEYDMSVVVVDSEMQNAFALPGGFIVVFSGIIDMIDDEYELAGLLAHEASHVTKRHSLRLISRDLATYLLFASLTGDLGGFSSVLIENSNMISSLSYSRKFEKEADIEGVNILANAEINPIGMVELFQKFEYTQDSIKRKFSNALTQDSSFTEIDSDTTESWEKSVIDKIPEFLSTHPSPKNRIKYLEEEISNLNELHTYKSNDSLKFYFKKLKN